MQKIILHGDCVQSGVLLVGGSNEGQGFLLIFVPTAITQGTLHAIVQVQLCATIVGFQAMPHPFALMNLPVGTAKSQGTMHMHVQMRHSAVFAADLGTLQRIAPQKVTLIHGFATIVTGLATWQWIVRMRRLATIAANQGTWPKSAETSQFATLAIRRATLRVTASPLFVLTQAAHSPHCAFRTLLIIVGIITIWGHSFVKPVVVEVIWLGSAPLILWNGSAFKAAYGQRFPYKGEEI